jgi:hypothetical protein
LKVADLILPTLSRQLTVEGSRFNSAYPLPSTLQIFQDLTVEGSRFNSAYPLPSNDR